MAQTDNRSLQEIKRETEQTRAGLTNTVEELRTSVAETAQDIRERISPAAIKAEVSQYIRSRGEQLLDDVTTAARKNPMQAIAVGASVAYPLLRIARSIPVPLLMLGAGVFLAGSKTGKAYTQKASDVAADLADQATRRAHDLGDQIGESVSAVKSYSNEKLDRLGRAVSGGTEQVGRAAGAAGSTLAAESQQLQGSAASIAATMADRAAGMKDQGMRMAGSAADTVADTVKGLAANAASTGRQFADTTREAGMDAARAVRDTASDLTDRASDLTNRAGKTIFQTIEQNPLLVAGVGLVVGGLIASALPRSDLEDEVVGGTSNAVKRYANSAAAQGLDVARNAVGEIYGEATRQAEAEGLSPDALDRTARDVGQKLRRVAETAVTTAFEPAQENHQDHQSSGPQGENNHG
jgi:HD-GYP domain-containing protein (c-di-GMP phosphodiesterase class II)